MFFKAKNSTQGVTIDGKETKIESLSGQKTDSEGVALLVREKGIYIPAVLSDLQKIIDSISSLCETLENLATTISTIPPSNSGGPVCATCNVDGPKAQAEIEKIKSELSKIKEELA